MAWRNYKSKAGLEAFIGLCAGAFLVAFSAPESAKENQNVYPVTACYQLQDMQNDPTGLYYLTKDIDCYDTKNWNGGAGFKSVENFTGTFDGLGFVIRGLYIKRSGYEDSAALFSYTHNASIANAKLEDVNITGGRSAGLIVDMWNSTIDNSYVKGTINSFGKWAPAGGLVASGNGDTGTIKNSYFIGSVSSTHTGGGTSAGGIVGSMGIQNAVITNCYALGSVSAKYGAAGGLVGEGRYSETGTSTVITDSYAATQLVFGKIAGGLFADMYANKVTVHNSYWDKDISNTSLSGGGGTPESTENMKSRNTFSEWDFENVWNMDYPQLRQPVSSAP